MTGLAVFEHGLAVPRRLVSAGGVAKVWGLENVQVGDRIGETGASASGSSLRRR